MNVDENQNPYKLRRAFLTLAAESGRALVWTTIGLGLAVKLDYDPLVFVLGSKAPEVVYVPTEGAETRFKSAGLSEYTRFYQKSAHFLDKHGATLFPHFFSVCDNVANNRVQDMQNSEEVRSLREGWNTIPENQKVAEAQKHVDSLVIDNSSTGEPIDDVRTYLKNEAEILPVHVASVPPRLKLLSAEEMVERLGYASKNEIAVPSFSNGPEGPTGTVLHEQNHMIDGFLSPLAKSMIEKERYITYAETYLDLVDHMLTTWYDLNENMALDPHQGLRFLLVNTQEAKNKLELYEKRFIQQIIIDPNEHTDSRLTRLAYQVGRRYRDVKERIRKGQQITEPDEKFVNDELLGPLLRQIVGETAHLLVDFVHISGQRITLADKQTDLAEEFLTPYLEHMQKIRLWAFSLKETGTTYSQLREKLGLNTEGDSEVKQLLKKYGAQEVATKESEKTKLTIYQLPQNPYDIQSNTFYLQFDKNLLHIPGALITLPKNISIRKDIFFAESEHQTQISISTKQDDKEGVLLININDKGEIISTKNNDTTVISQVIWVHPRELSFLEDNIQAQTSNPITFAGPMTESHYYEPGISRRKSGSGITFIDQYGIPIFYYLGESSKKGAISLLFFNSNVVILAQPDANNLLTDGTISYYVPGRLSLSSLPDKDDQFIIEKISQDGSKNPMFQLSVPDATKHYLNEILQQFDTNNKSHSVRLLPIYDPAYRTIRYNLSITLGSDEYNIIVNDISWTELDN